MLRTASDANSLDVCFLQLAERPPCDALIKIKGLSSPCDLRHVKGKDSFFHPSLYRLLILQGFALKRLGMPGEDGHSAHLNIHITLSFCFLLMGSSHQTSSFPDFRESRYRSVL